MTPATQGHGEGIEEDDQEIIDNFRLRREQLTREIAGERAQQQLYAREVERHGKNVDATGQQLHAREAKRHGNNAKYLAHRLDEVTRFLARFAPPHHSSGVPLSDVPTLIAAAGDAACTAWKEFVAGDGLRPSTRKLYRNRARQFLAWLEARGIALAAVTRATVESYLDSQATCAHERAIYRTPLRRLFGDLVAYQAIPSNPAAGLGLRAAMATHVPTVVAPKPSVSDGTRTPGGAPEGLLPDDAAAARYLERLRWPTGTTCVSCGHGHVFRGHSRKGRLGLYRCAACGRRFTVTAGTALGGGKLGPRALLLAFTSLHGGESLLQTSKRAGITYKTAQQLRQRIAEHSDDPLISRINAALDGLVSPDAVGADAQASLSMQPPAGPPSLAELKGHVYELALDPIEEVDEDFEAALLMLAALHFGTRRVLPLSRYTGVKPLRAAELACRLRHNGVWTAGGKTAGEWDEEGGQLAFWLDVWVATGMMARCDATHPPVPGPSATADSAQAG